MMKLMRQILIPYIGISVGKFMNKVLFIVLFLKKPATALSDC